MKKSSYTITMPYTDYEQLISYKDRYEHLVDGLRASYDVKTHDLNPAEPIRLDADAVIKLTSCFLPIKYMNAEIVY